MAELPKLDHTVINVRYDMDAAQAAFSGLGFHLTDRGYHTLGSINHLMMFGTDYLELIGLPAQNDKLDSGRPDIAKAPYGINGLVFKTSDVDETYAHLQDIGMAGNPPKSFSRPVQLADGTHDAKFRTAHLKDDVFPGGRVYFCEHQTPELVWRPEWQDHDNGTLRMPEFVIASSAHRNEAEAMAELVSSKVSGTGDTLRVAIDGCELVFLSPDAYRARFGDLASELGDRGSIFGAVVFQTSDLQAVRGIAEASGLPTVMEDDRVVIRQAAYDSVLEFVG